MQFEKLNYSLIEEQKSAILPTNNAHEAQSEEQEADIF
jgi:hypothetical protein